MTASDYLLVFDNVDDFSLIEYLLPHGDHGAVVTTSRDSICSGEWTRNSHQVLDFSITEGCEFLRLSLSDPVPVDIEKDLRKISDCVHGYPLALSQIAGFIRTNSCSMHDFWTLFHDKRRSVTISTYQVQAYDANLATVWDLSFSMLDDDSRVILEIFAFLDADSLPLKLFQHGSLDQHNKWPRLGFMADPLKFIEALKRLRSQSWVRNNGALPTISIHRFFQDNVRDVLHKEPLLESQAFEEALHLLGIIQPRFMNHSQHWNPQHWEGSKQYLQHVQSLEKHFLSTPRIMDSSAAKLARIVYHSAV